MHINLDSEHCLIIIIVISVVPLKPTGFRITNIFNSMLNITVTLQWDSPPGRGPEAIVDNYTITITPSHPISNVVLASPWNVTLNYDVVYIATITAVNCAGESEASIFSNFEFSKRL